MHVNLGTQPLKVLLHDSLRHVIACKLRLEPGERQTLTVSASQQYEGFSTTNPQADLAFNGSVTNANLLPIFGYDNSRELTSSHDRLEAGLAKRPSVLPIYTDQRGLNVLSEGATGQAYPYQITVSTEASQTALAPGRLMKQWKQSGRTYAVFDQKQANPDNWRIASARYQEQVRQIKLPTQTVLVRLYYQHGYNLPLFWQAIHDALRQGSHVFGPYPYTELRLAEVPYYNEPMLSMPGQITIAENQGWLANTKTAPDKVYALLTRAVLKQWTTNSLPTARVQGAGFLQHGLVEYLTLQAVAKRYGTQRQITHLAQALSAYRKGKNVEDSQEMTLLQADGDTYLERHKSALVLSSLGQVWGDANLTRFIEQFYRHSANLNKGSLLTAHDFANQLTNQLPDSLKYMGSYFNNRFAFDWQIAQVNQRNDEMAVYVTGDKWNDDGFGNTHPTRLEDHVVLAVLDKKGKVLAKKIVLVGPNEPAIWFPKLAGAREVVVDPLGTWPDAYPKNNRKLLLEE